MQTAQGSLTIINPHTDSPSVFWNGRQITGIQRGHIQYDEDENRVRLVVSGNQDAEYAEMSAAGIVIKKVAA